VLNFGTKQLDSSSLWISPSLAKCQTLLVVASLTTPTILSTAFVLLGDGCLQVHVNGQWWLSAGLHIPINQVIIVLAIKDDLWRDELSRVEVRVVFPPGLHDSQDCSPYYLLPIISQHGDKDVFRVRPV
jgi:hypothetical protein